MVEVYSRWGDLLYSATGGEDSSYDLVYYSSARITERGWQAEMAIHWSSLVLVAGMLPMADALDKTGGTQLIGDRRLALSFRRRCTDRRICCLFNTGIDASGNAGS